MDKNEEPTYQTNEGKQLRSIYHKISTILGLIDDISTLQQFISMNVSENVCTVMSDTEIKTIKESLDFKSYLNDKKSIWQSLNIFEQKLDENINLLKANIVHLFFNINYMEDLTIEAECFFDVAFFDKKDCLAIVFDLIDETTDVTSVIDKIIKGTKQKNLNKSLNTNTMSVGFESNSIE